MKVVRRLIGGLALGAMVSFAAAAYAIVGRDFGDDPRAVSSVSDHDLELLRSAQRGALWVRPLAVQVTDARVTTPVPGIAGTTAARTLFGIEVGGLEYSPDGRSTWRSNQAMLGAWLALLIPEFLLGTLAAWALGIRVRPRGFQKSAS